MYPYDYGYGYAGYGPEFGVLGAALHAAIVVVAIIVVLWFVRRVLWGHDGGKQWRHWRNRWSVHSGLEILNERYAKGEITKEEYEERRRTLIGD